MLQKNIEPTVFVKLTVLSFAFSFNVFIWIYELQKNPDCFNHYLHSYKSLHSNQRTDLKFLTSGTCLETGSLEQISSESPMGSWNFWQILKVPLLICHKSRSKWKLARWDCFKIDKFLRSYLITFIMKLGVLKTWDFISQYNVSF